MRKTYVVRTGNETRTYYRMHAGLFLTLPEAIRQMIVEIWRAARYKGPECGEATTPTNNIGTNSRSLVTRQQG